MLRKFRPRLTYANVVSSLALVVAVGGGTAFAVVAANQVNSASIINGQVKNADLGANSIGSGKVIDNSLRGADISESTLGKVPSAAAADDAANAGKLAGLAPTDFLRSDGKAVDASHADNADNATNATNAINANGAGKLDGLDSTAFARSRIYVRQMSTDGSANASSTCPSGDVCFAGGYYCDTGDMLVGGGFADIDDGTRLVASEPFVPNPQDAWRVKFVNNSTEDTITVDTICADNDPVH
jgi:hypothetical protein